MLPHLIFARVTFYLSLIAVDVQNCGLTEQSAATALKMMSSNTTVVILDIRHNVDICMESLTKLRAALRENERGVGGQVSALCLHKREREKCVYLDNN